MGEDAKSYRQQANHSRKVVEGITDGDTRQIIIDMATDFDAQADRLDHLEVRIGPARPTD